MSGRSTWTLVIPLLLLDFSPAVAHHNAAATYDQKSEIVHENVAVVEWRFANPHAHVVFEVINEDGVPTRWSASTGSVQQLRNRGYSRDTLQPGQIITVRGAPGRNDRPVMHVGEILLGDGTVINFSESAPVSIASTTNGAATNQSENPLFGYWEFVRGPLSDEARALIPEGAYFLPAFGQVTESEEQQIGDVPLTGKGKEFQMNWKDTDDECVAISGWMGLVAPYLLEFEQPHNSRVRINYEYMDLERTVWLDGRSFPSTELIPRSPGGYSIGHWEGDTLVVETRNMRSNLVTRNGIHHSENAVITEWISAEGDSLTIVRRLEDPDRFTRPLTSVMQRQRAAATEIAPWGDCVPNL